MKKQLCILAVAALSLAASHQLSSAGALENWTSHCRKCHDDDGSGQTKLGKKLKLLDYTDPAVQAKLEEGEMIRFTKEGAKDAKGKETMPAFAEKLTEQEILDLIALVRSFQKS